MRITEEQYLNAIQTIKEYRLQILQEFEQALSDNIGSRNPIIFKTPNEINEGWTAKNMPMKNLAVI